MTSSLIRRNRFGDTKQTREEVHVIREAEIGVIQPPIMECQGLLATETRKDKEGVFPKAFGGTMTLSTP